MYSYFTRFERRSREADDPEFHALANNGWIWNHDPLNNFAGAGSKSYFLREVIVWGDCVKLRFGNGPEDSPFLWSHMKKYTERMASFFAGFRIDNCHSTPIHVAQYLLDAARTVKPNLYVLAELFSGSEANDIVFVSKLGINSLIRESIVCWNPEEFSRQIHRHGGQSVGSFCVNVENYDFACSFDTPPAIRKLRGCKDSPSTKLELIAEGALPHALFMDCTHDNESPHQKRSAEDALSSAALVAFTASAIGSVQGYDELYPELLNLVHEKREYSKSDISEGIQNGKSTQDFSKIISTFYI